MKKILFLILLFALTFVFATAYKIRYGGNFHTVIPGELYRSAQPTPAMIKEYKEKYGIKTIINMRGQRVGKDWHTDEIKTSTALGIMHYDWAFSSTLETPLSHMDHLMWLMKKAEKPILIHCMAGADRSGLGVAVYLYGIKGMSAKDSMDKAMSIRFGHFPYLWSETDAIKISFEKFTSANRKMRGLK